MYEIYHSYCGKICSRFCEKYKKKKIHIHSTLLPTFSKILSRKLKQQEKQRASLTTIPFEYFHSSDFIRAAKKHHHQWFKLRLERINPRKNLSLEIYSLPVVAIDRISSRKSRLPARISNKTAAEVYTRALCSRHNVDVSLWRYAGYANGIRRHFGADNHGG